MTKTPMVVHLRRLEGQWRGLAFHGRGLLRLGEEGFELQSEEGSAASEGFGILSGARWRTGSLSVHSELGSVLMESDHGLDLVWVTLTRLACPLPEFTRGLRSLGSRRAGSATAQARFFAPLLQARRNLEAEPDLDARLTLFAASTLSNRMVQVLSSLAAERYPGSAPDRRALEAELAEAAAPLFARLQELEESETQFREIGDEARFAAWRTWLKTVARVFSDADRSWRAALGVLTVSRGAPR
jgi:hypothetical protein